MGAWIEITDTRNPIRNLYVAPHDGCVDWNNRITIWTHCYWVAPHDGCVDWNRLCLCRIQNMIRRTPRWVRGLKLFCHMAWWRTNRSHPTMGAWIEIIIREGIPQYVLVAPHDGCVDWNTVNIYVGGVVIESHPTMGAWIEILCLRLTAVWQQSRTPRWVRGLKSYNGWWFDWHLPSHPTMGAWIEITYKP